MQARLLALPKLKQLWLKSVPSPVFRFRNYTSAHRKNKWNLISYCIKRMQICFILLKGCSDRKVNTLQRLHPQSTAYKMVVGDWANDLPIRELFLQLFVLVIQNMPSRNYSALEEEDANYLNYYRKLIVSVKLRMKME